MNVATLPDYYTEELPLHGLEPAKYLALVQRAAVHLHWFAVATNDNTVMAQTQGHDHFQSEIITITIEGKKALLHCKPANEYYWDRTYTRRNTDLLKMVIAKAAERMDEADRNLHPMYREKFGALVPSKTYAVTPYIVYANVLVFLAMIMAGLSPLHPNAQSLFEWGGNLRHAVVAGEWWRLFTSVFLHAGIAHLAGNVFALLYIGMYLEPLIGKLRFASAYLLTGVFAGLMSIVIHDGSVGVGASGAIFGMYGVFFAMLTTTHIKKALRTTMLRSILFFIVFNLMMGLQGNTDNAAHIGGLLSGIVIGYALQPGITRKSPISKQLVTIGLLALGTAATVVAAIHWL